MTPSPVGLRPPVCEKANCPQIIQQKNRKLFREARQVMSCIGTTVTGWGTDRQRVPAAGELSAAGQRGGGIDTTASDANLCEETVQIGAEIAGLTAQVDGYRA
jgi:hypothetical protein